jgi:hypothetical protein
MVTVFVVPVTGAIVTAPEALGPGGVVVVVVVDVVVVSTAT